MREILQLTERDSRRVPWRNGRGVTEELALWPDGSAFERGDFGWRISKAAVEEAGPFSVFPGFGRVLVVTAGAGLELAHGASAPRARVRPLEPYRFDGGWTTSAELAGGPVADFNVLARRGEWSADVQCLRLGRRRAREALAAGHAFVHVLAGSVHARVTGEEQPFALGPRESLWARELRGGDEVELVGGSDDCVVLLARIVPGR